MKVGKTLKLLNAKGAKVVITEDGKEVKLRGVAIGGYLNMEHFINGYPGYESTFRTALASTIGEDKATFFFEKLLDNFLTNDDFRLLRSLHVNVVRIAVNYRHFVRDKLTKTYRQMGFNYLDRAIEFARNNNIYVIIDLHAAPGWQNPGWHSDNPYQINMLWYSERFQEDTANVWEEIAKRYVDEEGVAGYGLINEPDAPSSNSLLKLYEKLISRIRRHDSNHIIILEANRYGIDPSGLDRIDDDNIMIEVHYYPLPGFTNSVYPGEVMGLPGLIGSERRYYDSSVLEQEFLQRAEPIIRWEKPVYVGEFGSLYWNSPNDVYRLRVNDDLMTIFAKYGAHWTIWTYKDVGVQGLVYLSPHSEYIKKFNDLITLKYQLGADEWGPSLTSNFIRNAYLSFIEHLKNELRTLGYPYEDTVTNLEGEILPQEWGFSYSYPKVVRRTMVMLISHYLTGKFVSKFKGLTYDDLDRLAKSFNLDYCIKREELIKLIQQHCTTQS